jgi:hypothetical protein
MSIKATIGIGVALSVCSIASASGVGDVASLVDTPRLFNDFSGSNLVYSSNYNPAGSSISLFEDNYGSGGFANRHASWFGDAGNNKVDFNYGDGFDIQMNMQINQASNVGQVEAGFQADLFGFGLFGVLTGNGEIAAFGSVLPFYSFGAGLYTVGDEVMLRMVHRPGAGENAAPASTMEYMYNNLTSGSGWVSSGLVDFTTTEGGIPSGFDMFYGAGAQINFPAADGVVDINYSNITIAVPAPGSLGMLALAGIGAIRRRR